MHFKRKDKKRKKFAQAFVDDVREKGFLLFLDFVEKMAAATRNLKKVTCLLEAALEECFHLSPVNRVMYGRAITGKAKPSVINGPGQY